jgi:hypothetical protein
MIIDLRTTAQSYVPALAAILFVCLSGCALAPPLRFGPAVSRPGQIWRLGPGAAAPGILSTDAVFPNEFQADEPVAIPYSPESVEIVGWVESSHRSAGLSGRIPGPFNDDITSERNSDFGSSFKELVTKHRLDGLMNEVVDTRHWVINLYFIKFESMRTIVGGVGYRLHQ